MKVWETFLNYYKMYRKIFLMNDFITLQCPKDVFVGKKCAAVLIFIPIIFDTMMHEIFIPDMSSSQYFK